MHPRRHKERGFSLVEMLAVVAVLGLIAGVGIPALMQVLPQYRMRSSGEEIAATLRMVRQDALSTRRPWRVTFDTSNKSYAISMLKSGGDMTASADWIKMGLNNRPLASGAQWWKSLSTKNFLSMTMTASHFNDVDSADGVDVIFKYDGSLDSSCYSGSPYVKMHFTNTLTTSNTFYFYVQSGGYIYTTQTKE